MHQRLIALASIALFYLAAGAPALPAADEKPDRITVATWNLEWFYDHYTGNLFSDLAKEQSAPSREDWEWKLSRVAAAVAEMKPTILALQEVKNRYVVSSLAKRLKEKYGLKYRVAYIEGWDNYTDQDVAIIYQSGLVQYSFREQTREMFATKNYYNINKHLFATFEWGDGDDRQRLTLLNVHLRARAEKADLRQRQCRLLRRWLEDEIKAGGNVIALGDFNTEELAGTNNPSSDTSIVKGLETEAVNDDLVDLHERLAADNRNTHLIHRQFDRIFVSQAMIDDQPDSKDLVFSSIQNRKDLVLIGEQDKDHFNVYWDIPQDQRDISDHYPVIAEFLFK